MADLSQTARNPNQDFIRATPRNPVLGFLSDIVGASYSPQRTQQMQGVANFFGAPAISQTLDRLSFGEPLTTGAGGLGGTTRIRPEALEAGLTLAPFMGPAARLTKGLPIGMSIKDVSPAKARTWDALAAQKAKMLEDIGSDAKSIWQETGTWRGTDGQLRQEIDNSLAQIQTPPLLSTRDKALTEQENWNKSSVLINPKDLKPLNKIEDFEKYKQILDSMKESGYLGRPILAYLDKGKAKALTGSHRLYAAKEAKIDVPVIFVKPSVMKWEDQSGSFTTFQDSIDDQRTFNYLKAAGDDLAASLARYD